MANLPLYQVVDWNDNFESAKSRLIQRCANTYAPNKHGGSGWSNVMAEEHGAAIWGIWKMLLDICSRQSRPRAGWLTADGKKEGRRLSARELSNQLRRPLDEIEEALRVLQLPEVSFIRLVAGQAEHITRIPNEHAEDTPELPGGTLDSQHREDTEVSAEYPEGVSSRDIQRGIEEQKEISLSRSQEENSQQQCNSQPLTGESRDTAGIPHGYPDNFAKLRIDADVVQHAEAKLILSSLAKEIFPDEAPGVIWDNKLEHDLDEMLPLKRSVLEKVAWAYRLPPTHRLFQDKGGGGMMRRRSFASLIPNLKSEASKITDARKKIGLNGLKADGGTRKLEAGGDWTPARREAAVNLYGAADLPERFAMMPASCQAEIEKKIKERVA